jgi:hypothetical protein
MPSLGSLVEQATSFVAGELLGSKTVDGQAVYQSTRVIASFHSDDGFDGAVDSSPESSSSGPAADIGGAVGGGIGSAIGGAIDAVAGLGSGGDSGPQPFRIVGLSTHKAFGGSPGTWTLTVKGRAGTDVQRLWPDPEDVWVRIVMVKNGEPTEVMFGLMNTVTESMTRGSDGARDLTYTLQGEDFHKVLTATQLYINMHENAGTLPIVPMYDAVGNNLIGPPDSTVDTLICGWLGNNGIADKQWRMPKSLGGGYFFDLLERKFENDLRGNIYDPALYSPDQFMGKSLWSSLEEYANGILNEMFVRVFEEQAFDASKPPKPQLVLRERPFPSKDKGHDVWDKLTTHVLRPGDVKGRNMTKGAPESRFNYWLLDAKGLLGDALSVQMQMMQETGKEGGIPGSAPVYNMEDVRKHGFRRFSQGTRYFPFREDINWFTHSAEWLKLLHDWYAVAPFEISGTLEASAVFPKVRLGERIREERKVDTVTYYVEGVGHNWQYPGPGLTTLNLTRGEFEGEDLLDQVYELAVAAAGDTGLDDALALVDSALGLNVPTGSGPRLDRQVGQVDTPERLYLKQRGIDTGSQTALDRGEPQNPNSRVVERLSPSDLPDQLVPDDAEIAVGRAKPRERRQGGNLTQRELEQGVRLPVREQGIAPTERSKETADQAIDRWRKTGKR